MAEKIQAFQILDFDGFFKSIIAEAFIGSAMFVGKSFFRKTKKDMKIFKNLVIGNKDKLIPTDYDIMDEVNKYIFLREDDDKYPYILSADVEIVLGKVSDDITYKIMSSLADEDFLELCYSKDTDDFIWRIKK